MKSVCSSQATYARASTRRRPTAFLQGPYKELHPIFHFWYDCVEESFTNLQIQLEETTRYGSPVPVGMSFLIGNKRCFPSPIHGSSIVEDFLKEFLIFSAYFLVFSAYKRCWTSGQPLTVKHHTFDREMLWRTDVANRQVPDRKETESLPFLLRRGDVKMRAPCYELIGCIASRRETVWAKIHRDNSVFTPLYRYSRI